MLKWRKACEANTCIEVAVLVDMEAKPIPGGDLVLRSSAMPGAILLVTREEWDEFVVGVKAGKFDGI